jgi:hypothetical protein
MSGPHSEFETSETPSRNKYFKRFGDANLKRLVEHLPGMLRALGSIPSVAKTNKRFILI